MADALTESAVAAALVVGRRLGLPTASPEILHERSNVLVRLGSIVARVPATVRLARPDPTPWFARDVALSRYLTDRGVSVVSPTTDPLPGPHFADGLPVTLWQHVPHDPDIRYPPSEIAKSLGLLHAVLRDYPGDLPVRGPLGDLDRILAAHGDAMDGAGPRLRAEAARIEAALPSDSVRALHGDAHPGNVIATAEGPCWLDFEDTWRGPLAWDVATLVNQSSREALDAYPGEVDEASFARCLELRRFFGVCWRFVIAKRFPHRLSEAREELERYFA